MSKCIGCGIELQSNDPNKDGYVNSIDFNLCERCFMIKNYSHNKIANKTNVDYMSIINNIRDEDTIVYVSSLLTLNLDYICKFKKVILVLTKRDILPLSVNDEKLKKYFENLGLDYQDIIIVSANKNYNFDELLLMIKKHKSSKNVYVVGHTNGGKSTLINKMVQNYGEEKFELTISPLPSTTLNKVNIKLTDDITLIDTPGLVDRGSIVNYVDFDTIKKINAKKEIKPDTYQVKSGQCLYIPNLLRVDYVEGDKNSFTFFVSNDLEIEKRDMNKCEELQDLSKHTIEVGYNQDLVIDGLGFIKITEKATLDVYVLNNVQIFVRDSLI